MNALRISDGISLVFTTVMDELTRGLVDDDEEVQAVTDRAFWEDKGSRETVAMADELLAMIQGFDPEVQFKYNKFYIGLAKNGQPNNFAQFRAKKTNLRLELRLPETPDHQGAGRLGPRPDGLRQAMEALQNSPRQDQPQKPP